MNYYVYEIIEQVTKCAVKNSKTQPIDGTGAHFVTLWSHFVMVAKIVFFKNLGLTLFALL